MARSKTPPCSRQCGQLVWFNWDAKAGEPGRSDFGKLRPLQVSETGELLNEVHDCPNSTYGKQQNANVKAATAVINSTTIETLLGNSYDHAARLEKIEGQLTQLIRLSTQISSRVDGIAGQTHINNNSSESVPEGTEQ